MKTKSQKRNRGIATIYAILVMTALCMILSLAVDYGRAQLVKTELRRAADAAARAAAGSLPGNLSAATASAKDIASRNLADGTACVLDPSQDIQYGIWDVKSKK